MCLDSVQQITYSQNFTNSLGISFGKQKSKDVFSKASRQV